MLKRGRSGTGWFALSVSSLLASAFAFLAIPADGSSFWEAPLGTSLLAVWVPFLWTLVITVNDRSVTLLRILVGYYSLYHLAGPPVFGAGLPLAVLLLPWAALILYERTRRSSSMTNPLWRAGWAILFAQFPPHFPSLPLWASILMKALASFAVLSLPQWDQHRFPHLVRGSVLFASLTLTYLLGLAQGSTEVGAQIVLSLRGSWQLSVPLWIWLGANLVNTGGQVGRFVGRRALVVRNVIPPRFLLGLLLLAGALVLFASFVAILEPTLLVRYYELLSWVMPSPQARFTAIGVFAVLFLAGVSSVCLQQRMRDTTFSARYLSLLSAAVAFTVQLVQNYFGAAQSANAQLGWPAFLVALGLLQNLTPSLKALANRLARASFWVYGFLLLLLTALVIELTPSAALGAKSQTSMLLARAYLASLYGSVLWGLPALLITIVSASSISREMTSSLKPFMLGYLISWLLAPTPLPNEWLPAFAFGSGAAALLPSASPRYWLRWRHAMWLALGAVAFRAFAWALPLPILPLAQTLLEQSYLRGSVYLFEVQGVILVSGAVVAALIAAAWGAQPRKRWVALAAGVAAWIAYSELWKLLTGLSL
ncbi:MAG: hypothetical protein NZ693_00570 [Thermoflexales bacterium]|nr:hypothetical protein [Thermoflexales bacterium]